MRDLIFISSDRPHYTVNSYLDLETIKAKFGVKKVEIRIKKDMDRNFIWIKEEQKLFQGAHGFIVLNYFEGDYFSTYQREHNYNFLTQIV